MKSALCILFTIIYSSLLFSQYDFGLEVCDKDASIEGKLVLSENDRNVYIGVDAGFNSDPNAFPPQSNVAIGWISGKFLTTGHSNTLLGYAAGNRIVTGDYNTLIGGASGFIEQGDQNVFLGSFTGFVPGQPLYNRKGCVFIGYGAGGYETTNNKLYIENSNSTTPLIYGEFDNDLLEVNGTLHVSETLKLKPLTVGPTCTLAKKGLLYMDDNTNKLRVCTGSTWVDLH